MSQLLAGVTKVDPNMCASPLLNGAPWCSIIRAGRRKPPFTPCRKGIPHLDWGWRPIRWRTWWMRKITSSPFNEHDIDCFVATFLFVSCKNQKWRRKPKYIVVLTGPHLHERGSALLNRYLRRWIGSDILRIKHTMIAMICQHEMQTRSPYVP